MVEVASEIRPLSQTVGGSLAIGHPMAWTIRLSSPESSVTFISNWTLHCSFAAVRIGAPADLIGMILLCGTINCAGSPLAFRQSVVGLPRNSTLFPASVQEWKSSPRWQFSANPNAEMSWKLPPAMSLAPILAVTLISSLRKNGGWLRMVKSRSGLHDCCASTGAGNEASINSTSRVSRTPPSWLCF